MSKLSKQLSEYCKWCLEEPCVDAAERSKPMPTAYYSLENLEISFKNRKDTLHIPQEFFDFIAYVLEPGAIKHGPNNWLDPNGKKCSEKAMHDSMFHHLCESFVGKGKTVDKDTGKDPLLNLICRAAMLYTRRQRNIIHEDDK